jgi:DNA-binding response OmpR family regulator
MFGMTRIVLIVEDTEECTEALEVALSRLPEIGIRAVRTAEEALHCLSSEQICALVTDLNLPNMDGFDLIAAVRRHPVFFKLPILVISGDSDPNTPARVVSLGASAYFSKPFSPAQVRSRLEQLIYVP